jgi:hypothetical protein
MVVMLGVWEAFVGEGLSSIASPADSDPPDPPEVLK